MSIITAIIPALIVLDLLWWLWADRLLRKAGFRGLVRILHGLFFGFQLAALVAVTASRRSELWDVLPKFVTTAVYLWHLLILPLLLPLLVLGAVAALLGWIIRKIRARETVDAPPAGAGVSRRAFLAATAAFTPQLFTVGLTAIALRQLEQFRVRRMTIAIGSLPAVLDGLTITHVSDMHAGRFTRSAILREMTGAVNDLRSELVLVTGDLINGALHEIP
jgi:heme/copper-type cytochrome/quinol oxidase subunit 2